MAINEADLNCAGCGLRSDAQQDYLSKLDHCQNPAENQGRLQSQCALCLLHSGSNLHGIMKGTKVQTLSVVHT